MRKLKKSLALIMAIVFALSTFAILPVFAEDKVYNVSAADQLDDAIAEINAMTDSSSVVVNLTADIVYNEGWTSEELMTYASTGNRPEGKTADPKTFVPLGTNLKTTGEDAVYQFKGDFNGNGYTISGLCVRRVKPSDEAKGKTEQGAALIGFASGSTVNNVNIERSAFYAKGGWVAAVIGNSYTTKNTVSNVNVSDVELKGGSSYTAGIIGANYVANTEISNVNVKANITGTASLGGIFGYAEKSVTVNGATVKADISGTSYIGGIVGNGGTVKNVTNKITIKNAAVEGNFFATTTASAVGGIIGGLVNGKSADGGLLSTDIDNVVVNAEITGVEKAGGLIGLVQVSGADITNAVFKGKVNVGNARHNGGLVGCLNNTGSVTSALTSLTMTNSVFDAPLPTTHSQSGLMVGFSYAANATLTDCYSTTSNTKFYGSFSANGSITANPVSNYTDTSVVADTKAVLVKTRDELAAIIDGWGEATTDPFTNSTDALGALFNNTVEGIQVGYDKAAGEEGRTRAVRFIATLDSTEYTEVGVIIKMTRPKADGNGTESVTETKTIKTVYTSINAAGQKVLASEYDSKYLLAVGVNELDEATEITFEVQSFVTTLEGKTYITDNITVDYENVGGVIFINGKEAK